MTHYVTMFSGGIASWATAQIAASRPGQHTLLFCDVGGDHHNPHEAEDEDTYRFIKQAAAQLQTPLITLNQHETIWDVFERRRYLGNSRLANCSIELKQKPARNWLDQNCDPTTTTVCIGITWDETHRLAAIENAYKPYTVAAPLTSPPYMAKQRMLNWCRQLGVEPPRLYAIGAAHNNCGGGCVRAGQATFAKLLTINPDRYKHWETREQQLREHLNKNVAILRDWTHDGAPLTLREFRERQETGQLELFDELDVGGCGCFTHYTTTEVTE